MLCQSQNGSGRRLYPLTNSEETAIGPLLTAGYQRCGLLGTGGKGRNASEPAHPQRAFSSEVGSSRVKWQHYKLNPTWIAT
jgi:hypothetical protein